MKELAIFIALASAGVPLAQATKLSAFDISSNRSEAILISDVKKYGAPIESVGNSILTFEAELLRFRSEIAQATAVPIQTRKLLLWLPALSLLIGQLSGFNTFASLVNPLGLISTLLAAGLIYLGMKWSKRMLVDLLTPREHPGFELMRLGLAIRSGQALSKLESKTLAAGESIVLLAKRTGAPVVDLLESEIEYLATASQQEAMTQAKQLSVKLLIPMALTVLPAFFILTIVPMLLGIGLHR